MTKQRLLLCFAFLLCCSANAAGIRFFDSAGDFSFANNPAGAWSYGWSTPGSTDFTLYTNKADLNGFQHWYRWQDDNGYNLPMVGYVANPEPLIIENTVNMQPYRMILHPGQLGEQSVVRWTAPASGLASFIASVEGRDFIVITSSDITISRNGRELFSANIDGFGFESGSNFSTNVFVNAGDTIDFRCGTGYNDYGGDTTQLQAMIFLSGGVPQTFNRSGSYFGVFKSARSIAPFAYTSIQVGNAGNYIGQILFAGRFYSFAGQLDPLNHGYATISTDLGAPIHVQFVLSNKGNKVELSGQASFKTSSATMSGQRVGRNAKF